MNKKIKTVFLGSSAGYTYDYAIHASRIGLIDCEIVKIICDRGCGTIDIAKKWKIPFEVINGDLSVPREEYSVSLLAAIPEEAELVAISLKRLVSDPLISCFHNRIINTHPTLLPAYKGFEANKKMLNEGKTLFGGCSLHLVDELADNGPIIIQSVFPLVFPLSLSELNLKLWHYQKHNFTQTIQWFAEQRLSIVGNHAKIDNATYSSLPTNPKIEIDFTLLDELFVTE